MKNGAVHERNESDTVVVVMSSEYSDDARLLENHTCL